MLPVLALSALVLGAEPEKPAAAPELLAPLQALVGPWKGSGRTDAGTREERENGFWAEKIRVEWQFQKQIASLVLTIPDGKHFREIRIQPGQEKDEIRLTLTTPTQERQEFLGKLTQGKQKEAMFIAERTDGEEVQQFTLTLLHANRFLYQISTRPKTATGFSRKFQVGTTKDGESFAEVAKGQECIVSGGLGTIRVQYDGKMYFVCCSGCRDEFNSDPKKYIELAKKPKNDK